MSEKKNDNTEGLKPIRLQEYRSPDKLNEYVRIATPAAWVILLAMIVIVIALFIWGFSGTLPVHCAARGIGIRTGAKETGTDGEGKVDAVLCLVDPVKATARDLENKEASVVFRSGRRINGTTTLMDPFPLSRETISEKLGGIGLNAEWIVSQMEEYPFMYLAVVNLEEEVDHLYFGELAEVSVITEEVRPYRFLIGGEN